MSENKDLKNILSSFMKSDERLAKSYNSYSIEQIWRDTFGSTISNYTTQVRFVKGVLTVFISSAPLREEINMNKENVLSKLNGALKYKKVDKLIVR